MDSAYEQGSTITMDSGAIVLNDSTTGAANVLTINKSGAGSGDVIEVVFSAAHTGRGINLNMDDALAAVGIHIDSASDARTGADIHLLITPQARTALLI